MILHPSSPLKGEITVPGDKSISHRSIMLGAIARGKTEITNFLNAMDCLSTIDCFRRLQIPIDCDGSTVVVHGKGLRGLEPKDGFAELYVGNSGTTARLLSGILSGQTFGARVTGDDSITKRPMKRILDPLWQMNGDIRSENNDDRLPLVYNTARILRRGSFLNGIDYHSPVPSAQVKSCILLAGLYAGSPVRVTEQYLSRNHTELMMKNFGAEISATHNEDGSFSALLLPDSRLEGQKIKIPGDISSAAYYIAAALIVPGSELLIKNVGINPTRDGFLRVCRDMGGRIDILNKRLCGTEPVADLLIHSTSLHGTIVEGSLIPSLIDELPVIAVMASFAKGRTVIKDAAELKVKETDRIMTTTLGLQAMGVCVQATDDGMIVHGGTEIRGAEIDTYKDHRIAMAFSVAALAAGSDTTIKDSDCVNISYPDFYNTLKSLQK